VADAHEAVGEHVEEKMADELLGVKRQSLFSTSGVSDIGGHTLRPRSSFNFQFSSS
jgi:hypothetical protein